MGRAPAQPALRPGRGPRAWDCSHGGASGPGAAFAAAAALATFLLSYQVLVWLATDAPLLAAVSVALYGAYGGFYAERTADRLRGYTVMHAALAVGFLSKSAVAWMVPALALLVLVVWERRWRELARWELYAGLVLQALVILTWVAAVYRGPDGAAASQGVLLEQPRRTVRARRCAAGSAIRRRPPQQPRQIPARAAAVSVAVDAARRRRPAPRMAGVARRRAPPPGSMRPVRFALATALPSLALLSVAATARNIYLAPALPGFALLLGWWATLESHDRWDVARAARHRLFAAHRDAGVCGRGRGAACAERARGLARDRRTRPCSSPPSLRSGPTRRRGTIGRSTRSSRSSSPTVCY